MSKRRVERQWVPLKQYLPTEIYAELLSLIEHDPAYIQYVHQMITDSSETAMNCMVRLAVTGWLHHRAAIERLNGMDVYREEGGFPPTPPRVSPDLSMEGE